MTKAWLVAHMDPVFGFPSLVRFSWATCKTILDASGVAVQWWAPTGSFKQLTHDMLWLVERFTWCEAHAQGVRGGAGDDKGPAAAELWRSQKGKGGGFQRCRPPLLLASQQAAARQRILGNEGSDRGSERAPAK